MIQWLVNTIFKEYIDNLVDRQFRENTYERIRAVRTQELRSKAAAIRATLDNKTSRVSEEEQPKLQSSSRVRTGSEEPKLSAQADQAAIAREAKAAELDAMRAKLMGKKT